MTGAIGAMAAAAALAAATAGAAQARTLRVPRTFPTIQAAVDAAAPGDRIRVAAGRHCGAVINKGGLELDGGDGATIIGCAGGPALPGGLRIGFLLDGAGGSSPADGTRIDGFAFDGRGVANGRLEPLAFGVLARFADDVRVSGNTFLGTVQAVTNTGGDRWVVSRNRIEGLTLFGCDGLCGGGDGIVVQVARAGVAVAGGPANPVNRPEDNVVLLNQVGGAIPDGHDLFDMAGIFVMAADRTTVTLNRLAIPANPAGGAEGQGILVTNRCCGDAAGQLPGARGTRVFLNDGRASQKAVVVNGQGGENTGGLVLFLNLGVVEVEPQAIAAFSIATREGFQVAAPPIPVVFQ